MYVRNYIMKMKREWNYESFNIALQSKIQSTLINIKVPSFVAHKETRL